MEDDSEVLKIYLNNI